MDDTVPVAFRGSRSASDTLTWGQRAIWTAIGRTRPSDAYFNFARTLDIRDTHADLTTVLAAVAKVVSCHEALRTRMSNIDSEPKQVVSEAGEIDVRIVDGDEDTAARLSDEYTATAFDYVHEWPVRIAVVTTAGMPAFVVLCFCHLATDFGGSVFVQRDLRLAIDGRELTAPALQPVDLAGYQRSPAGRRAARAAADFWARAYERIPASMFSRETGAPETPRYQRAFLLSPALAQAATVLGERLGTGSSAVLNAAFAAAVGELTGHGTCAMLTITKNRFRAQTRDMVTTLALEGLLVVPLAEATDFDELVRTTWRAAVPAYRYAQYDERDRDRVVRETSERRGEFVHPYCCVNDLRDETVTPPGDGTQARELLDRSIVSWLPPLDHVSCRFCLHVGDTPHGLAVRLTADTAYVRKAEMTGFLSSVESLVVAAADGPVPLAAGKIGV